MLTLPLILIRIFLNNGTFQNITTTAIPMRMRTTRPPTIAPTTTAAEEKTTTHNVLYHQQLHVCDVGMLYNTWTCYISPEFHLYLQTKYHIYYICSTLYYYSTSVVPDFHAGKRTITASAFELCWGVVFCTCACVHNMGGGAAESVGCVWGCGGVCLQLNQLTEPVQKQPRHYQHYVYV